MATDGDLVGETEPPASAPGAPAVLSLTSDARSIAAAPAPRGKFWEVTFQDQAQNLPEWLLRPGALKTETGKTGVQIATPHPRPLQRSAAEENASPQPAVPTRAINLAGKTFDSCDINHFNLTDSSFSRCTFINCRFIKANFDGVKFSGCAFEKCHFLNVRFTRSQFIGCTFARISASAEHVHFVETSISAQAFVDALVTNVSALPAHVTAAVQEHRHLLARAKLAGAIFRSVRDQPELDQFFDATRTLELAAQRQQIADARWLVDGAALKQRDLWSRWFRWPARIVALWLVQAAGFLTDWGRSPAKSAWLMAIAVVVFTCIYALLFGEPVAVALLRALDNTFVFGYTPTYGATDPATLFDFVAFANALTGFCWYALLVPALSRRVFR